MFNRLPMNVPMYDPDAVQPMRDELIAVGFEELKDPSQVDRTLGESKGTVLVVVNSVCGCAAGSARPGVSAALQHNVIPDKLTTVFAGQDRDAVEHVRSQYLKDYRPSSPSMALFKDGKVVHIMERHDIEGRSPEQIASIWRKVFDKECSRPGPSIPADDFAKVQHAVACGSTIPRFNG